VIEAFPLLVRASHLSSDTVRAPSVRPHLAVVLGLFLLGFAAAAATAAPAKRISVTFVGDSVPASIELVPDAQRRLDRGLDVRLDLRVCRRLVARSCTYRGLTPATALQSVLAAGAGLGDVLIVEVGYNEAAHGYREGMRRIIAAAGSQGAEGIVWVTLREVKPGYRLTNAVIRDEARTSPLVHVADWNAYSKGKPWFGRDGLHLNAQGAREMAAFLRPFVLRAARAT
jgi:hypothetical protein